MIVRWPAAGYLTYPRSPTSMVYKEALTYHAFVDKNNTTAFKKSISINNVIGISYY